MKFYLNTGEVIEVNKIEDRFIIQPETYLMDFESYLLDPPACAGTYHPEEIDWNVIIEIISVHIFNRMVDRIEGDEKIEEIPFEENRIY